MEMQIVNNNFYMHSNILISALLGSYSEYDVGM